MNIIKLSDVIFGDRVRVDLGEVEELAESIRDHGLMHPIVIDDANNLIAGGRRYTAFTLLASNKVPSENPAKFDEIPFTRFEKLSFSQRKLLEIEENIKRKSMTWQEQVTGMNEYHTHATKEARKNGEKWSQQLTGELLGVSQASISIALQIAKELKADPTGPISKSTSLKEAITLRMQAKLDEAAKEQLNRVQKKRADIDEQLAKNATPISELAKRVVSVPSVLTELKSPTLLPEALGDATLASAGITIDKIASFYHEGDCLSKMVELHKSGLVINHIICDPPYGIDVGNLIGNATERIAETHEVDQNVAQLKDFLRVAYDVISPDGFLCMWYDLDHHEKIRTWAEEIGWKVCRWPLVWCKTSSCGNGAAQYNITKSTEVCYIMRRSESSLLRTQRKQSYVLCGSETSATHPFVKPQDLWTWLIETVSCEGQTILDPFAGEGSSLAAIFRAKRVPVGIEIDRKHIANGLNFIKTKLSASPKKDFCFSIL